MMLGGKVPARQAKEWGMIYEVVPGAELMARVGEFARDLARQPTRGLGLIKRAINASMANDLDAQLAVEARLQSEAGRTADYLEGVRAFQEKRPAVFRGT